MRALILLALATIAAAAFNQAPYDAPVKVTHKQVAAFSGAKDLRTLRMSTALDDKRRLASADNWLKRCFGACFGRPQRPQAPQRFTSED
ncbi:unnamed protein product, partial [Aphanomyces euteiches]